MAKRLFTDAAGREAYVDENNMVWTEGGSNPTYYNLEDWNKRQIKKYGESSSSSSSESYTSNLLKSIQEEIDKQTSYLEKYTSENPFVFDEELARQSAEEEYVPYYTELLEDYVSSIDLKRESVEDDKALQTELKAYDDAKTSREYTKAVAQAEQGFAGSGMFFSGIKKRGLGEMEVERGASQERSNALYDYNQRGLDRQTQALDLEQSQKERDIQREQEAAVEGGILTRQGEQEKAYYNTMQQSYNRKFPTSSNVLAGYVPSEYLRY